MPGFKKNNYYKLINCYYQTTLFVLIFNLFSASSFSQAPVISSFNPTSGPAGSIVTINGGNFTNAGAVIYFGCAKAAVISQNNTQIKVMVPPTANYQPVTVTVNSLTAYSGQPFDVTFNTGGIINAQTYANRLNFTANSNVSGTTVKDLDGDGKNDLIIVNSNAGNISFLQNTSNPGNLSFATAVTGQAQVYPVCVATGDLDGDGKPDIVVTNFNSNTITVFLNTSTTNHISIALQTPLQTGANPYGISIADFDGDGRPDIVVANHYSSPATISVFRNVTTSTGAVSFAPRIDLPANYNPRELITADIDNDGKPDIIVANQGAASISIFKNTSVNGSISFAPKFDLATPAGSSPESVATGDFNGDGKLDIAVANNNSPGSISIFQNISSSAGLGFLPRQDFTTGNNPYSITTGDVNGDGKPDIAVSNQLDNTVSILVNSGNINTIGLNPHIDYATGNYPRSVNIADEDGDGKPDIIVGNNNESTVSVLLSNLVTSLKPSIITFPKITTPNIDANNNINPGATSTNTETPITYTSSDTSVATITPDGLIHLVGPGITIITASQNGDSNYSAATPVSETLTVTESQIITIPAISAKTTCDADFSVAAVSTNSSIPLIYTSSNTSVATISSQGVIHITGVGSTIITVSQSGNSLYTAANPQSQTLTVNTPVAPIVNIAADATSICSGMTITYTATVNNLTNNLSYQWQVNGINTGTNSDIFTDSQIASTDKVQCVITYGVSCPVVGFSNSITGIRVDPYITPSITITSSAAGPVCSGTPILFTAVSQNGGASPTYQWQVNGITVGANNPLYTTTSLNNGDSVICMLTNNGGACITALTVLSNSIQISIRAPEDPAPAVTVSASANGVFAGVPVKFTATPVNTTGSLDYQWQVNGNNAGTDSPVFESSTLNNSDEITCILLIGTGCTPSVVSQPVIIKILQPVAIRIPNTFTPNGDGINDQWDIPDLAYYPNCTLSIYTRLGSVVYQCRGYSKSWNGSYNGNTLPAGAYYYVIDLGNNGPKLSGCITLIK